MEVKTTEWHEWTSWLLEEALEWEKPHSVACGRMIGPYACCSVVEGDCLELMKVLPDGAVDAVITDPPYGVSENTMRKSAGRGNLAECNDFPAIYGDSSPFNPWPWVSFPRCVLFGANHYAHKLPPSPSWIVWDKHCGLGENDNADCELAWVKNAGPARIVRHYWNGMLRDSERNEARVHPTQKPVAVMAWILQRYTAESDVIFDPFCGSGSTLIAAKKLGRHFLGFEISPEYCEIARERLAGVEAQFALFGQYDPELKPEQLSLWLE